MQTIHCQSVKELKTFKPCKEAMAFIKSCGSFRKAWNTCNNTSWMLWFLFNVEHCNKQPFTDLAKQFADHVKHLNNFHSRTASIYATIAAYAAYAAERKWQCDLIRSMFKL